jgi:hypothetical protein
MAFRLSEPCIFGIFKPKIIKFWILIEESLVAQSWITLPFWRFEKKLLLPYFSFELIFYQIQSFKWFRWKLTEVWNIHVGRPSWISPPFFSFYGLNYQNMSLAQHEKHLKSIQNLEISIAWSVFPIVTEFSNSNKTIGYFFQILITRIALSLL